MHSTYHEGKSVVVEKFNRTSKTKIYKYMTSTGLDEKSNWLSMSKLSDLSICFISLLFGSFFSVYI